MRHDDGNRVSRRCRDTSEEEHWDNSTEDYNNNYSLRLLTAVADNSTMSTDDRMGSRQTDDVTIVQDMLECL